MSEIFTFIGVDDVTPALKSIRSETEKLDTSTKKLGNSTKNLGDRMLTLNPRMLAYKLGVTAAVFSTIQLIRTIDELDKKLEHLDERTRKNVETFKEFNSDWQLMEANMQVFLADTLGPVLRGFDLMIAKMRGMTEEEYKLEQQRARGILKTKEEIEVGKKAVDVAFATIDAIRESMAGYEEMLQTLDRQILVKKALTEQEKESLELTFALQDAQAKWREELINVANAEEIVAQRTENLKRKMEELKNATAITPSMVASQPQFRYSPSSNIGIAASAGGSTEVSATEAYYKTQTKTIS